jgi:hypothetical protein
MACTVDTRLHAEVTNRLTRTVVDVGACSGELKCLSASRCHHLLSGFHPTLSATFPPLSLQPVGLVVAIQTRIANGAEEIVGSGRFSIVVVMLRIRPQRQQEPVA